MTFFDKFWQLTVDGLSTGSLYAVKDYYRIHDLMWDGENSLEDLLKSFCRKATEHGLSVIMDLVINHSGDEV